MIPIDYAFSVAVYMASKIEYFKELRWPSNNILRLYSTQGLLNETNTVFTGSLSAVQVVLSLILAHF